MEQADKTLWYSKESKTFYLVPAGVTIQPGNDLLEDMSGTTTNADPWQLQYYKCTEPEAKQHLEAQWTASVERAKKAWSQLYRLSELGGRGYDMNKLKQSLLDGLAQEGDEITQAFEQGKAAVEELLKAVEAGDPASAEEEQNIFRKLFQQVPGLGDLLSEEELNRAAADPDAWAQKLQEQFITPADKAKLKQKEEKLAAEIRESIAAGLRKAGIEPAGFK